MHDRHFLKAKKKFYSTVIINHVKRKHKKKTEIQCVNGLDMILKYVYREWAPNYHICWWSYAFVSIMCIEIYCEIIFLF